MATLALRAAPAPAAAAAGEGAAICRGWELAIAVSAFSKRLLMDAGDDGSMLGGSDHVKMCPSDETRLERRDGAERERARLATAGASDRNKFKLM